MIRFNFMCPHTRNLPTSRSDAGRYLMVFRESLLPIQGDSRFVIFRTGEANVKKHVWSEIGTGKIDGIGRTCRNNHSIKSHGPHDWNRQLLVLEISSTLILQRTTGATTSFTASGTYTISMKSGDTIMYQIFPGCVGTFVRQ